MSQCPHCGKSIDNILNGWDEVAAAARVTPQTAMKLHREQGLPTARISGLIYSTRNAIEMWVLDNIPKHYLKRRKRKPRKPSQR